MHTLCTITPKYVVEVLNIIDIFSLIKTDIRRENGTLVVLPNTKESILTAAFIDLVKENLHSNDGVAVIEDDNEQEEAEETWRNLDESIQQVSVAALYFYQPARRERMRMILGP